ncbi:MAG: D-alanyl-D-alanine carboxypeptidase [Kiritimatiellae bacterium]|nr:D-alanyl-D-alanine carboxypeptidase [Kiritimatiellia bacterium]
MKPLLRKAFRIAAFAFVSAAVAVAAGADGQFSHRRSPYVGAIAIEASSGRVLFADNADRECYPASCTKLMTARLLLKEVSSGRMRMDSRIEQSRRSALEQPSRIGLLPGETISVDDALKALMLKSANDIAVAIAERIGGSVEKFVEMMNAEARALGMRNTTFASPNGLPPPPRSGRGFDRSTASDLARLGAAIVAEQPELLEYTKLVSAHVPGAKGVSVPIQNHNNFLWKKNVKMPEVDGLKTGYIDAGGSSIVLTARRGGKRAIVAVVGSASAKEREAAAGRMMDDALNAISW